MGTSYRDTVVVADGEYLVGTHDTICPFPVKFMKNSKSIRRV